MKKQELNHIISKASYAANAVGVKFEYEKGKDCIYMNGKAGVFKVTTDMQVKEIEKSLVEIR